MSKPEGLPALLLSLFFQLLIEIFTNCFVVWFDSNVIQVPINQVYKEIKEEVLELRRDLQKERYSKRYSVKVSAQD